MTVFTLVPHHILHMIVLLTFYHSNVTRSYVRIAIVIRAHHALAHPKVLRVLSLLLIAAFYTEAIGFSGCARILVAIIVAGRMVVVTILRRRKLNILIFEFFLNVLLGIVQLGQLHLFLLNNEGRQLPPSPLLIPLCLLFHLIHLFVRHEVGTQLVKKV